MPPEWAPHARTWMTWPCRPELWGDRASAAAAAFADVAKAIADYEPVTVIARPDLAAEASLRLRGQGISVVSMEHDDSWLRDTGPTFLRNADGALAGVGWRFDGYGGRQPAFADDATLARRICERLEVPCFDAPLVIEGGNLHVDGEGTCLVTAASVTARNPDLGRGEIEAILGDHLGVDRVVWLENGLVDDETGGHVDNVACFARPGVVLALVCRDDEDPQFAPLGANLEHLRSSQDARGRTFEVIEVEQPTARHRDGRRVAASYLNFYLANGAVIMPMFDDSMDSAAKKAVANAFPERELVQVEAGDLVLGGGGIHCITQQQPVGPDTPTGTDDE